MPTCSLQAASLLLVLSLGQLCPAPAWDGGPTVSDGSVLVVELEGLKRVEPAALRARLSIQPRDELSQETSRGAIRALYDSGLVHDDVVNLDAGPDGDRSHPGLGAAGGRIAVEGEEQSELGLTQDFAFAQVTPLTETEPERGTVDVTFDIQRVNPTPSPASR